MEKGRARSGKEERKQCSALQCECLAVLEARLLRTLRVFSVFRGHLHPPRERLRVTVGRAASTDGLQREINSSLRKSRIHPADRLLVAEVVADGGQVDQVNALMPTSPILV